MERKLIVGQKLWNYQLEEFIIKSVGKKYFTIEGNWRQKYYIENLKLVTEYTGHFLHDDKEELMNVKEAESLYSKISTRFSGYQKIKKPSLEQLRAIDKILSN